MRISTAQYHQQAIDSINERSSAIAQLQEQLSSGKRINRASDDPIGAAEAERIRASTARMAMEKRMMSFATGMLSQADGALASASDSLQTARELMIGAGNGVLQPEDRKSIALQLENVGKELLAIANQRDGAGGYIFGGQGTATAPFTPSGAPAAPAAPLGSQQTGLDMEFDTTLDGREVFIGNDAGGSIFAVLDNLVVALRNESLDGEALSTALSDALTATDAGLDRVLTARTDAGEQLRIMESRTRLLESGELQAATRLAGITATDYAKVVSDMQTNQLAVQAAMATYAQISRLSLFDYL